MRTLLAVSFVTGSLLRAVLVFGPGCNVDPHCTPNVPVELDYVVVGAPDKSLLGTPVRVRAGAEGVGPWTVEIDMTAGVVRYSSSVD